MKRTRKDKEVTLKSLKPLRLDFQERHSRERGKRVGGHDSSFSFTYMTRHSICNNTLSDILSPKWTLNSFRDICWTEMAA